MAGISFQRKIEERIIGNNIRHCIRNRICSSATKSETTPAGKRIAGSAAYVGRTHQSACCNICGTGSSGEILRAEVIELGGVYAGNVPTCYQYILRIGLPCNQEQQCKKRW